MNSKSKQTDIQTTLEGIQAIEEYLATINGGLEGLLFSDIPESIMPELIKIYQAEQEVRQILQRLNLLYQ